MDLVNDIRELDENRLSYYTPIDIVFGGPPCQSFSSAGKRKGIEDSRGSLIFEFLRVVQTVQPRFFLMENVKGLIKAKYCNCYPVLLDLQNQFRAAGYVSKFVVLNAKYFNVPQNRERLFLYGTKKPNIVPDHPGPLSLEPLTLKDAIADLPLYGQEGAKYSEKVIDVYGYLLPGQHWKDLPKEVAQEACGAIYNEEGKASTGCYRRLSWDKPSPTLLTCPTQRMTGFCHPETLRPLSIREYARIQTFPDDFIFEGSISQKYKQIGNAVPVNLAKAWADVFSRELIK